MPAYLIVLRRITDRAIFEGYRAKVGPVIAQFGGRFLTRGGSHEVIESMGWRPEGVAIIEFPDMATLDAWYASPDYAPLKALRDASVDLTREVIIKVDGA
jgi:uncharacterized protein (DUF1330 family)